ncbi:hypothetical protein CAUPRSCDRAFT_259, partial [Caulochytrium protostelioides]
MVASAYHYLFLYETSIKAVSALTHQRVFDEELALEHGERVLDLLGDVQAGTFWIATTLALFEVVTTREDRHAWRHFLRKRRFRDALAVAPDAAHRDIVRVAHAEHLLSQSARVAAARVLADLTATKPTDYEGAAAADAGWDEEADPQCALRVFLLLKLHQTPVSDPVRTSLLCTWAVELSVAADGATPADGAAATATRPTLRPPPSSRSASTSPSTSTLADRVHAARADFYRLLAKYKDRVPAALIYEVLAGHSRTHDMLAFAELTHDVAQHVASLIELDHHAGALKVLARCHDVEIHYRYARKLLWALPGQTMALWTRMPELQPERLLSDIMAYCQLAQQEDPVQRGPAARRQACTYLAYVVSHQGPQPPAIHNHLVSLLVQESHPKNEAPMLQYLAQHAHGEYDSQYALRLCHRKGLVQCVIEIYHSLQLYEQGVQLALSVADVDLAKKHADSIENDPELRKRLYMQIARHVAERHPDVMAVLDIAKDSGILTLQDVLPLLPELLLMEGLKSDICHVLEDIGLETHRLQETMHQTTATASLLQADLAALRGRTVLLSPLDRCTLCRQPLLACPDLFAFGCGHAFHRHCLRR